LLHDAADAPGEVEAYDEAAHGRERSRHGGTCEEQHRELARLLAAELARERAGQVEEEETGERGGDRHEQGEDDVEPQRDAIGRIDGSGHGRCGYLMPPRIACPMLKMGR